LKSVNRAVVKSCHDNNIVEGSTHNYAASVMIRRDCRAVIDKILGVVDERITE